MLPTHAPARQQAHDLVDRLTPLQVSALIHLFEPLAREEAALFRAPFCDELPIDTEESKAIGMPQSVPGTLNMRAVSEVFPEDSDFWPAPGRLRHARFSAA